LPYIYPLIPILFVFVYEYISVAKIVNIIYSPNYFLLYRAFIYIIKVVLGKYKLIARKVEWMLI